MLISMPSCLPRWWLLLFAPFFPFLLFTPSVSDRIICNLHVNWVSYLAFLKKKLDLRGASRPPGIIRKKKVFSHRPRKFLNPRPIHTQGAATREKGRLLTYALAWGERGDFFTLRNLLPWEFELRTWGVPPELLTNWTSILWPLMIRWYHNET